MTPLRNGSADADGFPPSRVEARKSAHYSRPCQVSFNERSYKLTTHLAEESWAPQEEWY